MTFATISRRVQILVSNGVYRPNPDEYFKKSKICSDETWLTVLRALWIPQNRCTRSKILTDSSCELSNLWELVPHVLVAILENISWHEMLYIRLTLTEVPNLAIQLNLRKRTPYPDPLFMRLFEHQGCRRGTSWYIPSRWWGSNAVRGPQKELWQKRRGDRTFLHDPRPLAKHLHSPSERTICKTKFSSLTMPFVRKKTR